MNTQDHKAPGPVSQEDFAQFGADLAYVRETEAKDVIGDFPAAQELPPTAKLFVLHAADGTPILLGGDRAAVVANAREHNLKAVSLH